ncbi:MAG: S41 family peptidase [Bacteroidota bacterium]
MQLNSVPEIKAIEEEVYLPDEIRNGLIRKLFIKRRKGEYLVKPTFRTKGLRKQGSKASAFTGPVYFLISGASFSASAELASYAKAYRPNTYFVGQETGGAAQGNTSALSAFLVLKNSKLATYIPMVRYNMNITDYEQGRGVMPDYKVDYNLQSAKEGKNDLLEKALELCRAKKQ